MQELFENPYRVLGLAPTATRADIRNSVASLKMRARLGSRTGAAYIDVLGPCQRDEARLRTAAQALQDPTRRIVARVFRFWSETLLAGEAIDLRDHQAVDARISVLRQECTPSSTGDAARLALARVVVAGADGFQFPSWTSTLLLWTVVGDSPEFWDELIECEACTGFEPGATRGDVERVQSRIWTLLLGPARTILDDLILSGRGRQAAELVAELRRTNAPVAVVDEFAESGCNRLVTSLRESAGRIGDDLDRIVRESTADAAAAQACYSSLVACENELYPILKVIEDISGRGSSQRLEAIESVVGVFRAIWNTALDNAEDPDLALDAANAALRLASGTRLEIRLRTTILALKVRRVEHCSYQVLEWLKQHVSETTTGALGRLRCHQTWCHVRSVILPYIEALEHESKADEFDPSEARHAAAICIRVLALKVHNVALAPDIALTIIRVGVRIAAGTEMEEQLEVDECLLRSHVARPSDFSLSDQNELPPWPIPATIVPGNESKRSWVPDSGAVPVRPRTESPPDAGPGEYRAAKESYDNVWRRETAVIGARFQFQAPQMCPCCLGVPDRSFEVKAPGGAAKRLTFPICSACIAHQRARLVRMIATPSVSLIVFWLVFVAAVHAGEFVWTGLALGLLAGAGMVFALNWIYPQAELSHEHGGWGLPVAWPEIGTLQFTNDRYAEKYAEATGGILVDLRKPVFKGEGPWPVFSRTFASMVGAVLITGSTIVIASYDLNARIPTRRDQPATGGSEGPRPSVDTSTPPSPYPSTAATQTRNSHTARPSGGDAAESLPFDGRSESADDASAVREAFSNYVDDLEAEVDESQIRISQMEAELEDLEHEMNVHKSRIDRLAGTIESMERSAQLGLNIDQSAYDRAIADHNREVDAYNDILSGYRDRHARYKREVAEYNDLVDRFNRAVKGK